MLDENQVHTMKKFEKSKIFNILVSAGENISCKNFLSFKKYEESMIQFSGILEKILSVVNKSIICVIIVF